MLLRNFIQTLIVYSIFVAGAFAEIYHVAQTSNASDSNPGTEKQPFRTINRAVKSAQPGDVVLVYPGIYRECVRPVRGGSSYEKMITFKSKVPHAAIVKGSDIVNFKWKTLFTPSIKGHKASCYIADLPQAIFKENPRLKGTIFKPFEIPVHVGPYLEPAIRYSSIPNKYFFPDKIKGTAKEIFAIKQYEYSFKRDKAAIPELVLGEIFVRGIPLRQVRTIDEVKADKGTFCVLDNGRKIAVNFTKWTYSEQLEVTVRQHTFAPLYRGLGFIKVEGFTFEHAANTGSFPHLGMVSVRSGHDWIITNNIIRYAGTLGLDVGAEIAGHWDHISKGNSSDINEGEWSDKKKMPRWEKGLKPGDVRKHWFYHDAPVTGSHLVKGNYIYGNGHAGISALKVKDLVIENNIIEKNNRRLLTPNDNRDINFEEAAGIKILFTQRAIIRNNLLRDNYGEARGIWVDLENENCLVSGNICMFNEYGIDVEAENPNIKVYNNITAFNRLDGLSHRTVDFGWKNNTSAQWIGNLSVYNGNFGYAASILKKIPRNIVVTNNIFYGNQFAAIRFLYPGIDKKYGNIISGNVIGKGEKIQLQSGPPQLMSKEKMISEIKTALKLDDDKNETLSMLENQDWWYAGLCYNSTFDRITGWKNFDLEIEPVMIFSSQDKFKEIAPLRYPEKIFFDKLNAEVMLKFKNTPWLNLAVDKAKTFDSDYFGHKYNENKVIPGPFDKNVYQQEYIQIWPVKNK